MKTVFRLNVCCLLATSFFLVGCGEGGTTAPAGDDTSASAGSGDAAEAGAEGAGSGDSSGGSDSN